MSCLYFYLLVFLCLLNIGNAEYILQATPNTVEVGITEDVTLKCYFRGSLSSTGLRFISRLRILKEGNPGNFNIVAEAREFESVVHNIGLGPSAILTGYVENVTSSFISISWNSTTFDILGSYRCDAVGYKADQDVLVERTPVLVLSESTATIQDVHDLAIKQKAKIQQQIQAQKVYCNIQVAKVDEYINTKMAEVEISQNSSSASFQAAILQKLAEITANVKRLKDTGVFQYWPEGSYALLKPDSGCPNNVGALWNIGYRKFHTESTDRNYDQISPSSHLPTPTIERVDTDNFMYQHFCVSAVRSPGADWPRGSYCINRVNNQCPSGFSSGFVTWQDEVRNSKNAFFGALPDGLYAVNKTSVYYCCRADGSPVTPVYLPMSKPFYLYRYNGTCQEVIGMRSSPGDMTFDTDNSNGDAYENTFHPDGAIDNVHIELCYYSQL